MVAAYVEDNADIAYLHVLVAHDKGLLGMNDIELCLALDQLQLPTAQALFDAKMAAGIQINLTAVCQSQVLALVVGNPRILGLPSRIELPERP